MAHKKDTPQDENTKYLRALLLMQVNKLVSEDTNFKPEILLSQAGFAAPEIAQLLGKKEDAVRKSIQRAKIQK